MKTLTAVLFLLVVFSIPALADSGSYGSDFSNPQPFKPGEEKIEHPDVVMADEFVSIVLGADGAVVNAEFTFRNEGAAQMVPMYFPLSSGGGMHMVDEEDYSGKRESITISEVSNNEFQFTASANEVRLDCRVILEESVVVNPDYYVPDYGIYEGSIYYQTYAIYKVPFVAGETLMLRVEYHQQYDAPKNADWCQMYYPIHTGGSWKGPIGHGIVEVTAGSDFNWNGAWQYLTEYLPPAVEKDGKLVCEFDELEPNEYASVIVMMPWDNQPCWGIAIASGGINFRSERNNTSARVSAHTVMKEGEFFTIFERQGDWWRVEDEEGNSGWLRWRYVDPDTDTENIYAAITPGKNTYHALDSGG
jgi:hypothetical protein